MRIRNKNNRMYKKKNVKGEEMASEIMVEEKIDTEKWKDKGKLLII